MNASVQQRAATLADHQARAANYEAVLRRCTSSVEIDAAVLATVDGMEIASVAARAGYRPAQLAAMASSLIAVASAAGREVGHAACERLVVQSGTGTLLIRPLGGNSALVLCMAVSPQTVLGRALWAADEIARALVPRA
ncbi:MAG: roadblock/LC7 domain-containing protein [Proteobacteria bacterium]|nr:roadblock/LC7 domain-containing protein [Pseudomonadota bacterium]